MEFHQTEKIRICLKSYGNQTGMCNNIKKGEFDLSCLRRPGELDATAIQ